MAAPMTTDELRPGTQAHMDAELARYPRAYLIRGRLDTMLEAANVDPAEAFSIRDEAFHAVLQVEAELDSLRAALTVERIAAALADFRLDIEWDAAHGGVNTKALAEGLRAALLASKDADHE